MTDFDDDFVTFGNALEPLDEENLPRKKAITIEEQCAYDEQGRRRFHGAFTGGFSAGYFNSVGSRDGWTPQQFKSSRSNKAGNIIQNPEDYMDEEDSAEFGIAPKAVRATQEFTDNKSKGIKRQRHKQDGTGVIPGTPVLHNLLQPARERVGIKLLKQMGWKPGQGIGPRVTKHEKTKISKKREKMKIYGCALPPGFNKTSESESESSDEEYSNITFAPDDYEPYRCNPKDNFFGIGYVGLDRQSILSDRHINLFEPTSFNIQEKNVKLSIKGQAFGVGAFEVEDEDIYSKDNMSQYDFTLGPEKKSKSRWDKNDKEKFKQNYCIEGFVPSQIPLSNKKFFSAPVLPKDFEPFHKVRKSRFSPLSEEQEQLLKKELPRKELNSLSRAKILNEDNQIVDSNTNSNVLRSSRQKLFSNIIKNTLNLDGKQFTAERQKMEEQNKKTKMSWLDKLASTSFVKGESIGNSEVEGNLQDCNSFKVSAGTAESSTNLKPSFGDSDKQKRFEKFLELSDDERDFKYPKLQPLSMTEWERDQEILEFKQAAKLCGTVEKKVEEKIDSIDLDSLHGIEKMKQAAKMKMFGKLTRTITDWKPAKLVCVRFNIAEPSTGCEDPIDIKKKKKPSIFDSLAWSEAVKFEKSKVNETDNNTASTSTCYLDQRKEPESIKIINTIEPSLNETNKNEETTEEKNFNNLYEKVFGKTSEQEKELNPVVIEVKNNSQEKNDLFKAIFLDSSDESEGEKDSEILDNKVKIALIGSNPMQMNVERNDSPPRGIFANLDFENLIHSTKTSEPLKNKSTDHFESQLNNDSKLKAIVPETPKLINEKKHKLKESSDSDSDKSVKKSHKKKKSKKEKKKHKHKEKSKSKSKKKSKKEKR